MAYSFASHIAAAVALRWMLTGATVSYVSEPLAVPFGTITLTPLIWDVTVVCPLADSYVALAALDPSATVEMAASNKTAKYAGLMSDYHFQPIAVESLGPANESAIHFLTVLGKKIAQQTGDERETAFLFQRLSILVQRFNCVLLHNSFVHDDCPD